MIVSVVRVAPNVFLLCDYRAVYLVDRSSGVAHIIEKPAEVKRWVPSGLKYIPSKRMLFIANYLGHDILVFHLSDDARTIHLLQRIQDSDLIGPENVDVTPDAELIIAADYDGNALIAFTGDGKKLWHTKLAGAHGVAIDPANKVVYGTGLTPSGVHKYDLSGKELKAVIALGWQRNQYMWPTGVDVLPDHSVVVTDAHLGKVRRLDGELNETGSVGGNGLGRSLFNMPYGIRVVDQNRLLVLDTFKSRLIEMNVDGDVKEISQFEPYAGPDEKGIVTKVKTVATGVPVGFGYEDRINKRETVTLPGIREGKRWHLSYNKLVATDGQAEASLHGAMGLFTSAIPYWIAAKNLSFPKEEYLILGSPEGMAWLVIRDGIAIPLQLRLDLWPRQNGLLSSTGVMFKYTDVILRAEQKLVGFYADLIYGATPHSALCKNIALRCDGWAFENIAKSPVEKRFVQALQFDAPIKDVQERARDVIIASGRDNNLALPAIFLANLFLATPAPLFTIDRRH